MNKICFFSIVGGLISICVAICIILAKRCKRAETLADLFDDNDVEYIKLYEEGEEE